MWLSLWYHMHTNGDIQIPINNSKYTKKLSEQITKWNKDEISERRFRLFYFDSSRTQERYFEGKDVENNGICCIISSGDSALVYVFVEE